LHHFTFMSVILNPAYPDKVDGFTVSYVLNYPIDERGCGTL